MFGLTKFVQQSSATRHFIMARTRRNFQMGIEDWDR